MANNAEILTQLEKLAEGKLSGEMVSCYSHSRSAVSYYADLADFPAILAAFKRLLKIEEAAKAHVDKRRESWVAAVTRGYDRAFAIEHWPTAGVIEEGVDALDAALKEPQ